MRLVCVQVRLDAKDRAGNLQALNAAIDEAARSAPAPDLLVLPGDSDMGIATDSRMWRAPDLRNARENIASKAREWGVFIAAGLNAREGETLVSYTALFDADGDAVLTSRAAEAADHRVLRVWPVAGALVSVMDPSLTSPVDESAAPAEQSVVVAVPAVVSRKGRRRKTTDARIAALRTDPARGRGAYWAVAVSAVDEDRKGDCAVSSFVRSPDGKIVASADGLGQAVVPAEVLTGVRSS